MVEERPGSISEALAQWGLRLSGAVSPVAGSVQNQNYRVETDRGPRFVRLHRTTRIRERIALEHRVIRWAHEHGLPAVPPMAATDGSTLQLVDGRLVAVFPWVDGRHLQRDQLTPSDAAVMGYLQGRLQTTLAAYEDPSLHTDWWTWETGHSLEQLHAYMERLRSFEGPPEHQVVIQANLELQLRLLGSLAGRPRAAFDDLPVQPLHNDYHERNLILGADGEVVAVVDWDMVARVPRAFELARSLTLSGLLDPRTLEPYLAAYGRHITLSRDECERGVEMWWQFFLHDTWAYGRRLTESDPVVQPFFAEGIDRLERWSTPGFQEWLVERIWRHAGERR
jgi:Ser/Thr protein kinase RdoA (MazF antagonist)